MQFSVKTNYPAEIFWLYPVYKENTHLTAALAALVGVLHQQAHARCRKTPMSFRFVMESGIWIKTIQRYVYVPAFTGIKMYVVQLLINYLLIGILENLF